MFKPRLQRLRHSFTDHPVYFLTACTRERRTILANEEIHFSFVCFAEQAADRAIFVGRYVIMPDHLHLFAAFADRSAIGTSPLQKFSAVGTPPLQHALSDWMKALKRILAKQLRDMGVQGDCWQKGFFDHVMRSEESYEQKWLYVQQNPVRAGLVRNATEWPYQGEIYKHGSQPVAAVSVVTTGHPPPRISVAAVSPRPM